MEPAVEKQIYFLSDFHLGAPNYDASLIREKKVVSFLESIKDKASEIFIVGDIFDFWFEYKKAVPKGYTRLLGKLAELTDAGIPIHFFIGNHDMWMSGYFEQELNIKVYQAPEVFERNGKSFFIGHGDGLGPGDEGYKFIKKYLEIKLANGYLVCYIPILVLGWQIILVAKAGKKQEQAMNIF
jgi:UDP-2,3-diacylglucosamine hydrolase